MIKLWSKRIYLDFENKNDCLKFGRILLFMLELKSSWKEEKSVWIIDLSLLGNF